MTINYLDSKRIQGVSEITTTVNTLTDVVFDPLTEIGGLTYSGNIITRSVDSYFRHGINANFKFNNTGTQTIQCVAQNIGTSAWFIFGLATTKTVDVGSTGDASSQMEYCFRKADDNRTWIRQSSGAFTQVSNTDDNATFKITNDRTTVTYYVNGSSVGTTTHATPNAKYYPMMIIAQTGVDGSYAFTYSGNIIQEVTKPSTGSPPTLIASGISTTQLKAYYNFNESSGNIINQHITGNGLTSANLTPTGGSISYSKVGKIGNSVESGTTGKFSASTASDWGFLHRQGNSFSISLWFKYLGTWENGHAIMATVDINANNGMIFDVRANGNIRYVSVGSVNNEFTVNLANANWHHYVLTYNDATSKLQLWVDGFSVGTLVQDITSTTNPDVPLQLGDTDYTGATNGRYDELSLWNRVLTDAEIVTLYNPAVNLETNSIFEEIDTGVRFWYDGTVWKNNGSPSVSFIGIFSGSTAPNTYTANYEKLNLSTNVWDSSGSLSVARGRAASASTVSDAYIIAGQGSTYYNNVDKVNWSTNTRTTTNDFTYAPSTTGASAPTFCHILSYYHASYFTNSRKYTYANNSSVAGTSLTYKHVFGCVFGDKNAGFVVNGQTDGENHTEKYTYSSDTVTQKANPSTTATREGGHSGNKNTGVIYTSTIAHLYNLSNDVWTANGFTGMETAKSDTAICSTYEDYYMMGTATTVTGTKKKNYSTGTYTSLSSFVTNRTSDSSMGAGNDNWGVNY